MSLYAAVFVAVYLVLVLLFGVLVGRLIRGPRGSSEWVTMDDLMEKDSDTWLDR